MSSDNIRDDNQPHIKSTRINRMYQKTHESEPIDRYREYLAQQDDLDDDSKNPRNLFHEVNSIDAKWFNIARIHLSRGR